MKNRETPALADTVRAIQWTEEGLKLLDQRYLPGQVRYLSPATADEVAAAIRDMAVRGAPAIGIAAAYAVVLAEREARAGRPDDYRRALGGKLSALLRARPTAVNLQWAVARMQRVLERCPDNAGPVLLAEAQSIHREDIEANREMGRIGAACLQGSPGVLTHCNTGSLATGGFGTALGVIRTAFAGGRLGTVFASETRPWLQGSRLTVWELQQDGIPVTLVADSAGAWLMQSGRIQWVIVGADRIAANGDVANKIGTYAHAVSARHHGLGFMVVAPVSTIDMDTASGRDIAIEQRRPEELLEMSGHRTAPAGSSAYNPVFDITPARLVSVLVTERGAIEAPDRSRISRLFR